MTRIVTTALVLFVTVAFQQQSTFYVAGHVMRGEETTMLEQQTRSCFSNKVCTSIMSTFEDEYEYNEKADHIICTLALNELRECVKPGGHARPFTPGYGKYLNDIMSHVADANVTRSCQPYKEGDHHKTYQTLVALQGLKADNVDNAVLRDAARHVDMHRQERANFQKTVRFFCKLNLKRGLSLLNGDEVYKKREARQKAMLVRNKKIRFLLASIMCDKEAGDACDEGESIPFNPRAFYDPHVNPFFSENDDDLDDTSDTKMGGQTKKQGPTTLDPLTIELALRQKLNRMMQQEGDPANDPKWIARYIANALPNKESMKTLAALLAPLANRLQDGNSP